MRLQYRLSNGTWVDCNKYNHDRTAEFLARCVEFGRIGDEPAVLAALTAGEQVRNALEDWYSECRDGDVADARENDRRAKAADKRPVLRCRKCGQTGHSGQYPFSTLASSGRCDDCL